MVSHSALQTATLFIKKKVLKTVFKHIISLRDCQLFRNWLNSVNSGQIRILHFRIFPSMLYFHVFPHPKSQMDSWIKQIIKSLQILHIPKYMAYFQVSKVQLVFEEYGVYNRK